MIFTIAGKELRSLFASPLAWLTLTAVQLVASFAFLKRIDDFRRHLDRTLDRATMGILTASLVIGSSIVMTVQGGPRILEVPIYTALGLGGYVMAFCNSLWIIWGIWRSGK